MLPSPSYVIPLCLAEYQSRNLPMPHTSVRQRSIRGDPRPNSLFLHVVCVVQDKFPIAGMQSMTTPLQVRSFCPLLKRTLPPCSTLFLTDLARYRHAPTLSCATNTPGWLSLAWHQSQWSESLHIQREICPLALICTVNLLWSGAKAAS